ncbi:unnamed protein product [Cladocopium goreaui]|uniref:BD-FAE-like domain-containing protein n=1 Tax=Cladocopium goreaui TaxID=2562237 RepID=A0A9P1C1J6_9DINO|nr:unnamed protein product [Cladocopium goreaui]
MAASPAFWDVAYGPGGSSDPENSRFLRLHPAPVEQHGTGTVVVLHGGYWKNKFGLDDAYGNAGTISLGPFFLARGFSVVEVEYRRRDHEGGGWPGTNEDVLMALRRIAELKTEGLEDGEYGAAVRSLRPDRLMLIGHSAGGCLALWAAHHLAAESGAERAAPLVLAAAPVADLVKGFEMKVSDEGDAVELYMKQPPTSDVGLEEYRKASPAALLPVTFPLLLAYGDADADVPPLLVRSYAEQAKASAPEMVTTVEIPGADHFHIVNAESEAWRQAIVPALAKLVGVHFGADAAASLMS